MNNMCNLRGIACRVEPTDNYHLPLQLPSALLRVSASISMSSDTQAVAVVHWFHGILWHENGNYRTMYTTL